MLQKLNERLQGVIAWIIVILVTITFAIFGVDYFIQNRHGDASPEVKVNSQVITKREFDINLRRISQMRDREGISDGSDRGLKQQVLEDMILNLVTVQAADKNGFSVNSQQANMAIMNIPQFLDDGQFSNAKYTQALHNALYTHETFQEEVKKGMLVNQQRFALVGTEFALPDELQKFVSLFMQKRDYKYLSIPAASFASEIKISDAEINDYYNKHQKEYYYPEQVALDYVRVSAKDIRDSINLSEDRVRRYYDENVNSYMSPARWKVARILLKSSDANDTQVSSKASELATYLQENPDKFADKVVTDSDDKTAQDGMIPEVVAGTTELDTYLVDLNKDKLVSEPVKVDDGYAIFKLVKYTPATPKSYNEVNDMIKTQLLVDEAQTKYAEVVEKLADLSYQSPDSLEMVGKGLDLDIKQTEVFDRNGGSSDLTKNKTVLKAAFSQDILELGNNSEPLQVDNDSVVVIRVSKHVPASKMPLSAVKEEITQLLTEKQAHKLAVALGKKVLAETKGNFDYSKPILAGKNEVKWIDIKGAARDTNQADPVVNDLAFTLQAAGNVLGKSVAGGNYIIVSLEDVYPGETKDLDKEQVSSINQQIESGYGLMDYNLYINGLMNAAKVVKN